MKIICDTTFLDGRDRFEKDEQRTVSDERGRYFIANKWAHEAGDDPAEAAATAPVSLDIQSATHGQEVRHG
jgi:hypothetical protein